MREATLTPISSRWRKPRCSAVVGDYPEGFRRSHLLRRSGETCARCCGRSAGGPRAGATRSPDADHPGRMSLDCPSSSAPACVVTGTLDGPGLADTSHRSQERGGATTRHLGRAVAEMTRPALGRLNQKADMTRVVMTRSRRPVTRRHPLHRNAFRQTPCRLRR
jgi:hypothetical protein